MRTPMILTRMEAERLLDPNHNHLHEGKKLLVDAYCELANAYTELLELHESERIKPADVMEQLRAIREIVSKPG